MSTLTLDGTLNALVWLLLSLAFLVIFVIWVTILAVTWAAVSRFVMEYKKAGEELAPEPEEEPPFLY